MIDSDYEAASSNTTPDFPWPPRENDSVLEAAAATWQQSVFHPASFFRRMPREFDFGWVLGYYLVLGVIAAGIGVFWRMVLGPSFTERLFPDTAPGNPIVDFLLSPLILLIALFVATGIVHLFLLLLRGSKHGFGTTLRVFCYSSGPQIFNVVPFVGPFVGGIWTLVLTVIGLREGHETTTGKALAAILVPTFFLLVLLTMLIIIGLVVGASQLTT